MLEALLTLMVLASGANGKDAIRPGNANYQLELAFEQAQADGAFYEDAIALQMAQANERVAEAQAAHAEGNTVGVEQALGAYGLVVADLAESVTSAENVDDDALVQLLDADLNAQDEQIAELQQEGEDPAEGDGTASSVCTRTDHPVGEKIAEMLGISYDQVMALACSDASGGMGFGQIMMAAKISQASGTPLDQIVAMRAEGKGWGQLKKELGVTKPGGKPGKSGEEHGNGNGGGGGNADKCTDKNPKDDIDDVTGQPCPPKGNGGGGNADKCTDKNPKDDIDDVTGQPCPPKGNGGGGNGNAGGNGKGKNCPDKNPKDGVNDLTGEVCPPKEADDDDAAEDQGETEETAEPTEAAVEPTAEATVEATTQP